MSHDAPDYPEQDKGRPDYPSEWYPYDPDMRQLERLFEISQKMQQESAARLYR